MRMCVLLWARDGRQDDLRRYEDTVLALLEDHRGTLILRSRVQQQSPTDPTEVQVIEFADASAMDGYMDDPRRTDLHDQRDAAIADTQILRLDPPA